MQQERFPTSRAAGSRNPSSPPKGRKYCEAALRSLVAVRDTDGKNKSPDSHLIFQRYSVQESLKLPNVPRDLGFSPSVWQRHYSQIKRRIIVSLQG